MIADNSNPVTRTKGKVPKHLEALSVPGFFHARFSPCELEDSAGFRRLLQGSTGHQKGHLPLREIRLFYPAGGHLTTFRTSRIRSRRTDPRSPPRPRRASGKNTDSAFPRTSVRRSWRRWGSRPPGGWPPARTA